MTLKHLSDNPVTQQLLVYCILSSDCKPLPEAVQGIDSLVVEYLPFDGLLAVVSLLPCAIQTPEISQLESFYRVITHYHQLFPVVPMRWGQIFADREAALRALSRQAGSYQQKLERVTGCVEMSIHAIEDISAVPVSHQSFPDGAITKQQGTAFLQARKNQYGLNDAVQQLCKRLQQDCISHFAGVCRQQHCEVSNTASGNNEARVSCYLLVPETEFSEFHRAYQKLLRQSSLKLMLTGPWPPFNFVE